eukprot:6473903-Amphidinium_carterae.2
MAVWKSVAPVLQSHLTRAQASKNCLKQFGAASCTWWRYFPGTVLKKYKLGKTGEGRTRPLTSKAQALQLHLSFQTPSDPQNSYAKSGWGSIHGFPALLHVQTSCVLISPLAQLTFVMKSIRHLRLGWVHVVHRSYHHRILTK